ncbi:NADPH:adrenodoxin oxidoreductase, mitochondrial isoform X3 [Orussus abietinus]|uniref:NADPH:adrenodoxin oxidoreductase, mitochondrial isoform X3 n=1 Tax=Orussus abietinus TaxID=222816 RepID=UPI000625B923|nr:NADPH:adrenodoxin oxidoreductase, mitochondrial isoform X3 [Orussus abietinus]
MDVQFIGRSVSTSAMRSRALLKCCARSFSTGAVVPRVCIVGSGPAGFYAAQKLIKTLSDVEVDILERLPVPFGLVRFGVAPDHPEVKNVINTFHKVAKDRRVRFIGNVKVGQDVTIRQLKENYHAVLLSYGAEQDKTLGIPGENLGNVISARRFVGWYNGVPSDRELKVNLDVEEVAILGQGNVAIDVARILAAPIDRIKTDITAYALEELSRSKVRKIWIIGRRGPLQVAFTIAELRELINLEKCKMLWRTSDFTGVREIVPNLARPRKRLTELMLNSLDESSANSSNGHDKEIRPVFLRSPVEFFGVDSVEAVKLSVNRLEGDDVLKQVAKPTGEFEEISCGLAFRSIGYKSTLIDEDLPFDAKSGRAVNDAGKVGDNLYTAGWLATGPVGVILTTMTNAFQVAQRICKELNTEESRPGWNKISEILNEKGVRTVSYEDWEKIDKVEIERGKKLGKAREKIVDVNEMLKIIDQ